MIHPEPTFFQVTLPHERALVRVLLMAQRRRLNSAVMVDRLANEFSRQPARSLRQVARLLGDGVPVIDALEQSPRALDPAAVMALRLAIETGTFPERLESLIAGDVNRDVAQETRGNAATGQVLQVIVGVMVAFLMFTFMILFIIPTIKKMYSEFELELPLPMQWFITIGSFFVNGWVWLLWMVILLFALGMTAFGKPLRSLGVFKRSHHCGAALLALFGLIVQSRRPLLSGIGTLARVHPVGRIRRRLVRATGAIEGGEDGWQALADQRFLSTGEARSLQMTDEPLAQAWLLRRAAQTRRFSTDLRLGFWIRFLSLLSLLALSGIVLLAAVGMFMSVYGLVEGLSVVGYAK